MPTALESFVELIVSKSPNDPTSIRELFTRYMSEPEGRMKVAMSMFQPFHIKRDFASQQDTSRSEALEALRSVITHAEAFLAAVPVEERTPGRYPEVFSERAQAKALYQELARPRKSCWEYLKE